MRKFFLIFGTLILMSGIYVSVPLFSNDNERNSEENSDPAHELENALEEGEKDFNAGELILNHVADANEFHIVGNISIPLPCIIYDNGIKFIMSSRFHHGHKAVNGYVLDHGILKKIQGDFPDEEMEVHIEHEGEKAYLEHGHHKYEVARAGFLDLSITKNVFTLILVSIIMLFIFLTVAKSYKTREGKAPKGLQSFFEPLIIFVRDDIAKPNIGPKYEKYQPYLLTVFFFIWINNMVGLIPFFPGSANVTGNIMVTLTLAMITFLITTFSGNKNYWRHIFWMPGVPIPIRIMLAPIEIIGMFTKPFALMIRLFANITAGHIVILSFVSLIFIFGNAGENMSGGIVGAALAVPFMIFMNIIELLVAFLQAFIFTILSALFIGQAIEEHH